MAAPRGYCAGVDRAVITVEKALETYGAPIYVRKQIVHNRHVVEDLESAGRSSSTSSTRCRPGSTVVFSAHGVSPAVQAEAKERGLKAIDATCPLVTKVHQEAQRFARDGLRDPADRPRRPRGGRGHHRRGAGADHAGPVAGRRRRARGPRIPSKLAWLSQTTLSVDETLETVGRLREKFPLLMNPPSDDICYATQNRQLAVKQIAAHSRPGHRGRLGQLLQLGPAGRGRARGGGQGLVPDRQRRRDRPGLARRAWTSVGVTSGASVPDDLVQGVLDYLVERGFPAAREERLTEESLVFALPPELRRDLRRGAIND